MKTLFILFFSFGLCLPALALSPLDYENNPQFMEAFRIKVWNLPGGTIEVSRDEGKNWEAVGRVVYPTEKVNPEGYAASRWVADGKVAATAVNAIHIKTSSEAQTRRGVIFSILPREFLGAVKKYKSYLSPDASIYTDIPAGQGIFGGGYAPYVGNVVMLSRLAQPVIPLPRGYVPQLGDKIYIMVDRPADYPKEMVFENNFGGKITITYFNGEKKVIGQVLRPVSGVGRFEGTKYASAGRIRANHPGVIDVSTSPMGMVGGFQIVPERHGADINAGRQLPQWMVIGPVETKDPDLEGKAPFFKYFIKPDYQDGDLDAENWDRRLLERFLVEVKLKGNDHWQTMPVYAFDDYYLSGDLPEEANDALSRVTSVKILFPVW